MRRSDRASQQDIDFHEKCLGLLLGQTPKDIAMAHAFAKRVWYMLVSYFHLGTSGLRKSAREHARRKRHDMTQNNSDKIPTHTPTYNDKTRRVPTQISSHFQNNFGTTSSVHVIYVSVDDFRIMRLSHQIWPCPLSSRMAMLPTLPLAMSMQHTHKYKYTELYICIYVYISNNGSKRACTRITHSVHVTNHAT